MHAAMHDDSFECIADRIVALHKAAEMRDDVLRVLYPHRGMHWEQKRKKAREVDRSGVRSIKKNPKRDWQAMATRIVSASDPSQAHELAKQLLNLFTDQNDILPEKIKPQSERLAKARQLKTGPFK